MLPSLHAFSPRGRRPFVAILSDDAHALRDARLGSWETHPGLRLNYTRRASLHAQREASSYALSDLLLHITRADSEVEGAEFPFLHRDILRLALNDPGTPMARDTPQHSTTSSLPPPPPPVVVRTAMDASNAAGSAPLRIGFLGNGQNPTNHLAVQWFLSSCWGRLRARHPTVRLRLAGNKPNFRMRSDGTEIPCDARVTLHCGWAWATEYASATAQNGVDELGFLGETALEDELRTWTMMIVPVLQTTGINTKVCPQCVPISLCDARRDAWSPRPSHARRGRPSAAIQTVPATHTQVYEALRRGIPLVITRSAFAPFEPVSGLDAALFADNSSEFTEAVRWPSIHDLLPAALPALRRG